MRYIISSSLAAFVALTLLVGSGCKKPPVLEKDLRISTNAASSSISLGPNFDFNLIVESVMPRAGVQIEYSVKGEADNQDYPQGPVIGTNYPTTKIILKSLPRQKICVCTITVTSKSKSSNSASTSFKIVYK